MKLHIKFTCLAVVAALASPLPVRAAELKVLTAGAFKQVVLAFEQQTGHRVNLAIVGVMVKEGAPRPDIGTVDAFKAALLAARSVAYIDPKSGGSSGNITAYATGLGASAKDKDAAQALIKMFSSPAAADLLKSKGMEPAA